MAKSLGRNGSRLVLRPTRRVCTGMAAATGAILLASGALWFWQNGDLELKAKEVKAKHEQVEHGKQVALRLDSVKQDFQDTANKLRYLENSVSQAAYVRTMLDQIADLAKSVDLTILRFEPRWEYAPQPPTDPEKRKTFKPIPYDMVHSDWQIQGTYWSMERFINKLTQFQKIIAVDSVQLLPQAAMENQSPRLNINLKMTGFAFHSDARPSVEATPAPILGQGAGTARRRAENQVINSATAPSSAPK